jgi:integrase/recombinase XerD
MKRLDIDWNVHATTDFEPALRRFRRYLEDNGFRKSTIEGYVGNVGRYLKFAGIDKPSEKDRITFRDELHNSKLSRSTLNQYGYAIKSYHSMLGEEVSYRRLNPNNYIPYYFTADEVQKIFDVCDNLKHFAMLNVIFYGALRASELCSINDEEINLKDLTIRVREGKGGREGIAYITDECATVLKQYLNVRPPFEIDGQQPLFYTDYGQRWGRNEVHRMFVIYKKKAGIERTGGVHVFARHTPATIMIAKGCDIRIVKEVLRHRDIRTTLRYAHVADKTKRERYEQYLVL